jgi:hypothetical protein
MNESVISKTSEYFKKKGIVLPKISELCNPHTVDKKIINKLKTVDKDAMDPLNLFQFIGLITEITSDFQKYLNMLFYLTNLQTLKQKLLLM